MSSPHADRNLLFGILALQMDLIGRDALVAAMHAWVLDKAVRDAFTAGKIDRDDHVIGCRVADKPEARRDAVTCDDCHGNLGQVAA
jgi:hypothetical protein